MLTPDEQAAKDRGEDLKRYVRAAAALRGLYKDEELAVAAGTKRGTVAGWWRGARPTGPMIQGIARATGLVADELMAFTHLDGPPPTFPDGLWEAAASGVREGIRRDQTHQRDAGPDTPARSPERPPRGSGAGRT